MKLLVAATVALVLHVGSSEASTTVSGGGSYQRVIDRSKVPTPNITVYVTDDVRGFCAKPTRTILGCAGFNETGEPTIALRSKAPGWVFRHEIGHHFDYAVLSDSWRWRFSDLFGLTKPWDLGPIESFADLYELCMRQRPRDLRRIRWRSFGSHTVRLSSHRALRGCRMITRSSVSSRSGGRGV